MPTVLTEDGFRVMIRSSDHLPPHVHVRKAGKTIRVWLQIPPPDPDQNIGFTPKEVRQILALVEQNRELLLKRWRDIHG